MKKPLLIFLLHFSFHVAAQTSDSAFNMLRIQNARLDTIQLNLVRFSDHYSTGTVFIIGGTLFTIGGAVAYAVTPDYVNTNTGEVTKRTGGLYAMGFGSLAMVVGTLTQIAAHKFIRRAGGINRKPIKLHQPPRAKN